MLLSLICTYEISNIKVITICKPNDVKALKNPNDTRQLFDSYLESRSIHKQNSFGNSKSLK